MHIAPSAAALVLPGIAPDNSLVLIGAALERRGYIPATTPPPRDYPRGQDEWLAVISVSEPTREVTLSLLEDVDAVFRLARWLAQESPQLHFAAIRRYMGGEPVAKFYGDGEPQWRDGQDPDHELLYGLPTVAPAGAIPQRWGDEPASATEAGRLLDQLSGPWDAVAAGNHSAGAWVRQDSPLA